MQPSTDQGCAPDSQGSLWVGLVQPKEPIYPPLIMENQMEKKMDNEMETAIYRVM